MERVFERDDLTVGQRQELAAVANEELSGLTVEVADDVDVTRGD